ncbi:MAG TPA: ribose 5-phosphate isomerase B [bacterium]|jgi:ribose 5-phosphate isomerase B
MKIAIGCDHAGFTLKSELVPWLLKAGYEIIDVGTMSLDPVDYPDYARAVGLEVISGNAERGIIICGSGVGACVAANKMKGVRAGLSADTFSARQGVEDDDVNVLCLGARVIGGELAKEIVIAFLKARFSHLERHERRLKKVLAMEAAGA